MPNNSVLTKISLAAFCAMLILPFLNPHHLNPIPTFFQEWTAAACGIIATATLLRKERLAQLEIPHIALLPLGMIGLLLLQFVFGLVVFPTQALIFALYLLWAVLILTLGQSLRQQISLEKLANLFAAAILAGALLASVLLALQLVDPRLGLGWVFPLVKGSGNLAQVNHLADYLWLGIASLIYLNVQKKIGVSITVFFALTLLSAASLTGSRSVFLYAFGFALLSLWAAWHFRQDPLRQIARISLLLLPATLLLQVIFSHIDLAQRLSASLSGERVFSLVSGTSQRLQLWRTALAIFSEHPWLGAGVGQFPVNSYFIVGAAPDGRFLGGGEHAHNLILHLLSEFGVVAPLLAIVMGYRWWLGFVRQEWSSAHWWIAAVLLVLTTHSQLEYPLWYVFFLGIAALVLGIGSTTGIRPKVSPSGRVLVTLILIMGMLTLATMAYDYRKLERTLNGQLISANEKQVWKTTLESLSDLQRGSLFSHYVDLSYAYQLSVDRESLKDKITVTKIAIQFSPVDLITFKLAYLLALDGQQAQSKLALRRALATHPSYAPTARKQLTALVGTYPELNDLLSELDRNQARLATPN